MALSPNVVVVAPGDLITATHVNNIRSNLDRLDVADGTKLDTAGGTVGGDLIVGGAPITGGAAGIRLVGTIGSRGEILTTQRTGTVPNLVADRAGTAAAIADRYCSFQYNETTIGSIAIASATSIAFNTTSDPRTKTAPPVTRGISDAAARAAQLGAGAWQGQHIDPETGEPDGRQFDFLSSHDVQDVAPYAVYGERDAVDPDTGAPIWQEVDFGSLVPLLFAALSDALTRIVILEGAGT